MRNKIKAALVAAFVCGGALCTTAAHANTLTMLLVRSTLSNDADADGGGLYQYEGGVVENAAGTAIGHYIVTRRVTTSGTSADNTAGEIITLFFPNSIAGNVPNNMTLSGAYSYNTGQFAGSVSAVSARYRLLNGNDATAAITSTASTTKLTIDYIGVNGVP